jgi:hypothetical protein
MMKIFHIRTGNVGYMDTLYLSLSYVVLVKIIKLRFLLSDVHKFYFYKNLYGDDKWMENGGKCEMKQEWQSAIVVEAEWSGLLSQSVYFV